MAEVIEVTTMAEAKEILMEPEYQDKNFIINIPLEGKRGEVHGTGSDE